jgi:hypothetical protein
MARSLKLISCTVLVLAVSTAQAAVNNVWTPSATDRFWPQGPWSLSHAPTASETAVFNAANTYSVGFDSASANPTANDLLVSSGNLTFYGLLRSGFAAPTLNLNGTGGNNSVQVSGATLTIGSPGTMMNVNAAGFGFTTSSALLTVAYNSKLSLGTYLEIDGGSTVAVTSQALLQTPAWIDVGLGGNGALFVDGVGSSVSTAVAGIWGYNGNAANVTFQNGAIGTLGPARIADFTTTNTTGVFNVLSGSTCDTADLNLATVGGTNVSASLNVQGDNSTLTIRQAGTLTAGNATSGKVDINVGTLSSAGTGATFITGTGAASIRRSATVTVGSGSNKGKLNVNGDTIIDGATVSVAAGSSINVAAGKKLSFHNSAVLKGDGTLTGLVSNTSGQVAPSGLLTINGTFNQNTLGKLLIELGGTTVGTLYDRLSVTGLVMLNGTLDVKLINSFNPAVGSAFDILDWTTLSGTFATRNFPALTGAKTWDFSTLYTTGVISVVPTYVHGDFNRDGLITNADLSSLLKALTDLDAYRTTNQLTAAQLLSIGDFNNSGTVTNADMQGLLNLIATGGGSLAPVPEPSALAIAAGGIAIIWAKRRKSNRG